MNETVARELIFCCPPKFDAFRLQASIKHYDFKDGIISLMIDCDNCGHCVDLHAPSPDDPVELQFARAEEIYYFSYWIERNAFQSPLPPSPSPKITCANSRKAQEAAAFREGQQPARHPLKRGTPALP